MPCQRIVSVQQADHCHWMSFLSANPWVQLAWNRPWKQLEVTPLRSASSQPFIFVSRSFPPPRGVPPPNVLHWALQVLRPAKATERIRNYSMNSSDSEPLYREPLFSMGPTSANSDVHGCWTNPAPSLTRAQLQSVLEAFWSPERLHTSWMWSLQVTVKTISSLWTSENLRRPLV